MTNSHIADDLPRLLTGDAGRAEVLAAAEHLRHCDDCRQELVSTTVAHASLTSARRFAPEVVSGSTADDAADATLPDLTAVFAEARAEKVAPVARRRRAAWGLAAAAAVVGAGVGTFAVVHDSGSSSPQRHIALTAFDIGHSKATATVSGGRMRIDAASLPNLDAQHRYEVWLTDAARTRMQPLGWIDTNGSAELTVPASLMNSYRAIEVSVQQVDASSYDYSGTSVLRGSYG